MKRLTVFTMAALCLLLTGCSAAAFFLSGCGGEDADLVIVNSGRQAVWSIELDYGSQTEGIQSARERPLMEQGQSYGVALEEGTETVTVILSGRWGRELARQTVVFSGERLYPTLDADRTLTVSEEWYNG